MFTDEQVKLLKQDVPKKDIKQKKIKKKGGGYIYLSYIDHHYFVLTMNRIFGAGNWTRETLQNILSGEETRGNNHCPLYVAESKVTVINRETGETTSHTGTGTGTASLPDRWQAHDVATKAAETDAMKRAGMMFGNRMGLSLRKDGDIDSDEESKEESEPKKYYNADGTVDDSFDDVKTQLHTLCNFYYEETKECGYKFALGQYGDYVKKNIKTIQRESAKGRDMNAWFMEGIAKLEEWHAGQKENGEFIDETMKVDDNVLNM